MDVKATTSETTDPNTDSKAEGAGTDTADTSQANEDKKVDPKVEAAFQALKIAGIEVYTKRQVNGRETALRQSLEKEAETKAETARQETERKSLEAQQQFKPLYEQAQTALQEKDAQIATMEPVLVGMIERDTKDWPKVLLDKKPQTGGYVALSQWYAAYQDIAGEMAKTGTQGKAAAYGQYSSVGKMPPASGNGKEAITPLVSMRNA